MNISFFLCFNTINNIWLHLTFSYLKSKQLHLISCQNMNRGYVAVGGYKTQKVEKHGTNVSNF